MERRSQVKQNLLEIEQHIKSRKDTDRIMWFSMWAVLSVASFGVAWFPTIYYLIKRRNAHFARQEELEKLILSKLIKTTVLTLASILIVPAFSVFYFLKRDLQLHEAHEHDFLSEVITLAKDSKLPMNIQGFLTSPSFTLDRYIILSVVTFGLAAAYWLYRIFNDYNNHFKMQWMIEDELLRFLKGLDQKDRHI